MSKIRVDDRQFKKMMSQLTDLPVDTFKGSEQVMKKATPKRSGNAQNKTNLQGKNVILADYAYADRLDKGWSNQAPGGFSEPTINDFIKRFDNALRRL